MALVTKFPKAGVNFDPHKAKVAALKSRKAFHDIRKALAEHDPKIEASDKAVRARVAEKFGRLDAKAREEILRQESAEARKPIIADTAATLATHKAIIDANSTDLLAAAPHYSDRRTALITAALNSDPAAFAATMQAVSMLGPVAMARLAEQTIANSNPDATSGGQILRTVAALMVAADNAPKDQKPFEPRQLAEAFRWPPLDDVASVVVPGAKAAELADKVLQAVELKGGIDTNLKMELGFFDREHPQPENEEN